MTGIHPTAVIAEGAELGTDVEIGPYCVLGENVRVGDRTTLKSHVVLDGHIALGRECRVFPFASLGTQTQDLKFRGGDTFVEIGDGTTIREYVTVNSGTTDGETTRVGSKCLLMAYSHVAHGCRVADGVIMANCATLAGHVVVEARAIVGGLSAVHQFCRVGEMCMIGGCTRVTQDCPPYTMVVGNPAQCRGINTVGLQRRNVEPDVQKRLKTAYRLVYRQKLATSQAIERIRDEIEPCDELETFVSFIESSERGIVS